MCKVVVKSVLLFFKCEHSVYIRDLTKYTTNKPPLCSDPGALSSPEHRCSACDRARARFASCRVGPLVVTHTQTQTHSSTTLLCHLLLS